MSEAQETSDYPGALDTWQTVTDKEDLVEQSDINKIKAAIEAVQTELGVDVAGSLINLVTRLSVSIANDGAISKGTSFPVSTTAGQLFFRTDENIMYIRNEANDGWLTIVTALVNDYFNTDGTCMLSFDNAVVGKENSLLNLSVTLTSLDDDYDLVDGKVGKKCYSLDGLNDYITIPANSYHYGMTNLTIEAWVNANTVDRTQYILEDANNEIQLYLSSSGSGTLVAVVDKTGGTHSISYPLTDEMSDGQWHYIVLTVQRGAGAKLYIDGNEVDTASNQSGTVKTTGNINIGADSSNNNKWDGEIDGVRMYRRTMSATEIAARYTAFA